MNQENEAETIARVIIVDDDKDLLAAQAQGLQVAGFQVTICSSAAEALKHLHPHFDGVILSDVRMPRTDGVQFMEQVKAIDPEIPILLITGHGDVEMAVSALKTGAYDFLTKPFPMDKLIASLRQAAENRRLVMENRHLRTLGENNVGDKQMLLGDCSAMVRLREALSQLADVEVDVLITGDTGTGKETAARCLHVMSSRRNRPFIHLNCASLSDESFQVDLFGSVSTRTGYSSAGRTIGRLQRAHKGFVLFDEVDALSLAQQAKLINVIESREIWPVGSEEPLPFEARIVATSKRDLRGAVEQGEFRADLFYRLSGVSISMPQLAQRRADMLLLFQHFVVRSAARLRRSVPRLTDRIMAYLQTHEWPGNVRELEQFAERFASGLEIVARPEKDDGSHQTLSERMMTFESDVICQALILHKGNVGATASYLGLARKTFYDKIVRHGIQISNYRP